MMHFVANIQYYMMFEVLECSWDTFNKEMQARTLCNNPRISMPARNTRPHSRAQTSAYNCVILTCTQLYPNFHKQPIHKRTHTPTHPPTHTRIHTTTHAHSRCVT